MAEGTVKACARACSEAGVETVLLSGGVFQNRRLLQAVAGGLDALGLRVLVPELLPVGDGGIAFGQVAVAAARLRPGGLMDAPGAQDQLAEILATTVFVDGANRPFGELTVAQTRGRADELRSAVGFGPTARVAPVARAWRELAMALEQSRRGDGRRTGADQGDASWRRSCGWSRPEARCCDQSVVPMSVLSAHPGRRRPGLQDFWASLDAGQRRTLLMMASVVVGLHVLGFLILFAAVAPGHYALGKTGVFTVGIGMTAYTLGLRHAFDADHISAIDNTTRKLMQEGKRPLSVGFWFSLGHSSIVFALAFLISVGVRSLDGPVRNGHSALHQTFGLVGTGVSGVFLYLIAAINLVILMGIIRVFREMKSGQFDEAALERQLDSRGFMNRFFGRLTRSVTRPQQMYPIGALFGLGFDTATEVALLVIAGSAGAAGLPWYAVLCLPILFAAGMSLMDSIDGSFMNFAYGWAFSKPVRKVFYNLTITGLSVAIALVIGTIEVGGLLADRALADRAVLVLVRRHRPERPRLRHRRHVRGHLAGGGFGLAARPDRGALDRAPDRRQRWPAVTATSPEAIPGRLAPIAPPSAKA